MKRILLFIACVSTILLTGCSETEETTMLGSVDKSALNTVGKVKKPEHIDAPAAPQMPGVGTPSITGVSYYSDVRLTKPLTGTIKQGKTIYTKVVFSEPMKHTASDEKNARPILSFLIDGKGTRYRVKPHRTSGQNFQSGDCKPLGNGTDDYICKYTIQADDAGMFSLKVGKFSMDTDGNTLANTYTHETMLQLGQQAPPEVTEVSYYSDARLTKPLTGTIKPGKTIYTKVVFSEPMKHTASDEKNARPILSFLIDGKGTRYRVKPHRTSGKNFQSGDCKPLGNGTDDYICKYTVQADDAGMFSLKVGKFSIDTDGNTLANTYTHETMLQLGQQAAQVEDEAMMEPTVLETDVDVPQESVEDPPVEPTDMAEEMTDEPSDPYTPLEGLVVFHGTVNFTIGFIHLQVGEGCLHLNSTLNGVRYEAHFSKWQRRDDAESAWEDIPGTSREGICGYSPTDLGQYRLVCEISISGVRGKYASENILEI